jgi:hypothetical protein
MYFCQTLRYVCVSLHCRDETKSFATPFEPVKADEKREQHTAESQVFESDCKLFFSLNAAV